MNMDRWKPNQICPYGIGFGDIVDGGYFMLARIQLLQLKLKLLGIGIDIRITHRPCKLQSNFSFIGCFPQSRHIHNLISCGQCLLPQSTATCKV